MSVFTKRIDADIRDTDHTYDGSWTIDESSAWNLGNPGAVTRNIGLRFTGVNVPQGATINSAKITFRDDDTKSVTLVAKIQGIDEDNTVEFVISPESSARTRTKTSASVNWNASVSQSTGSDRDTPDVSSIVQEIVDRGGWSSGNAMAFFLSDNGSGSGHYLSLSEYSDNPNYAALLTIDYTESGPIDVNSSRESQISGSPLYSSADRGIKLAKDGFDITSTNPDDYNLWTKYPPLTFLEKKTVQITVDTTDGCPAVGTLTESVAHDYDFIPFVIARIEDDTLEEKYDLPLRNIPVGGAARCDVDHYLAVDFDYTVRAGYVDIDYRAYCAALVQGDPDECISSNLVFNVYLYFYMWELGSDWPA